MVPATRGACALHDISGLLGGDMLDHDLEALMIFKQRQQRVLHEHAFAVENVDRGIGGFAVDQHRHADPFHPLQHRADGLDVPDAVMGVGRGARRIEFCRDPRACGMAFLDLVGGGVVGEIAGHHRLEIAACGPGGENARAVGFGGLDRRHRRHQVGHDDAARELPGGERQHGAQHRAVAQVDMPVVGPADRRCCRAAAASAWPRR